MFFVFPSTLRMSTANPKSTFVWPFLRLSGCFCCCNRFSNCCFKDIAVYGGDEDGDDGDDVVVVSLRRTNHHIRSVWWFWMKHQCAIGLICSERNENMLNLCSKERWNTKWNQLSLFWTVWRQNKGAIRVPRMRVESRNTMLFGKWEGNRGNGEGEREWHIKRCKTFNLFLFVNCLKLRVDFSFSHPFQILFARQINQLQVISITFISLTTLAKNSTGELSQVIHINIYMCVGRWCEYQ